MEKSGNFNGSTVDEQKCLMIKHLNGVAKFQMSDVDNEC